MDLRYVLYKVNLYSTPAKIQAIYGAALRRTASVQEIQVAFPLNLSRQFFNIIFVRRKTHCSFSVKYTWFVFHLSDEKTKDIYMSYIL